MPNKTIATFYIAGMKHYVPEGFVDWFRAGDNIQLRPEPDNKFDKFAVEVSFEDTNTGAFQKVGYVPRTLSKGIATAIAAGRKIKAKIAEDAKPKVIIFEEEDEGHG